MGMDTGSSGERGPGDHGGAERSGMVGRLSQISSRTNLMAIDNLLRALPKGERGHAEAALEAGIIARRLVQTTREFAAAMRPVTEPAS